VPGPDRAVSAAALDLDFGLRLRLPRERFSTILLFHIHPPSNTADDVGN
jgi:hypothetical protein